MKILSHKDLRFVLTWMVLVALLVRGIIPVGFMPDFSNRATGAARHVLAITLCGGAHGQSQDLKHKQGEPSKPSSDGACPFSINTAFALDDVEGVFALPVFVLLAISALRDFVLSVPHRFGNASPRAPPLFF